MTGWRKSYLFYTRTNTSLRFMHCAWTGETASCYQAEPIGKGMPLSAFAHAHSTLIQHHLQGNGVTRDHKFDGRISNILSVPGHGSSCITSVCLKNNQLRLFDFRSWKETMSFGWAEPENLTRYCRPAVHMDGNLVACGSVGCNSPKINFWDLRFNGPDQTPLQSIPCAGNRILKVAFSGPSLLLSLSSDGAFSFIDYRVQ